MFLNTFEELADGEVDEVVDISLDSDLEAAVRQAVTACVEIIGVPQPSEDKSKKRSLVLGHPPSPRKRKRERRYRRSQSPSTVLCPPAQSRHFLSS